MGRIVDRMVGELETQIAEKDVHLVLTDDARQWLAHNGFDPKFGARPMARLIQKEISIPLSEEILFGFAKRGAEVEICLKSIDDGLYLQKKIPQTHAD